LINAKERNLLSHSTYNYLHVFPRFFFRHIIKVNEIEESHMSSCSYDTRETKGTPSTGNIKIMRDRYLSEPMSVDVEYMKFYTQAHKKSDGMNSIERRAHCHAFAMENITPVIRDGELFAGNKTRFVRGAIPYANYATNYILRTLNKEEQEAQAKFTEIGTGGGIEKSQKVASEGRHEVFGKKFIISHEDKVTLREIAEYWSGKCMQDVADKFWKPDFDKVSNVCKCFREYTTSCFNSIEKISAMITTFL